MADSLHWPLSRYSRSVRGYFRVPRPTQDLTGFRCAIQQIVERHQIDRIIPTCEEIFFYDDSWSREGLALRSDLVSLDLIHNKFAFAKHVERLQFELVGAPESRLVESRDDLLLFQRQPQEWVFKPVYSRFASQTLIAPTPDELRTISPTPKHPWVAQQLIRGTEYSTYCIAHQGKLVAFACYHSVFKAGKGSGIYFVPRPHQPVEEFTQTLVAQLGFTGQLGLDLIEDSQGRVWILEGNPRATSGVHLFRGDVGLAAAILNQECEIARPKSDRPVALYFAMPIWGLNSAYQRGLLSNFASDWWQATDPVFQWRDPGPTFGILPALAELMWISLRERRTLSQASTLDIEWNGEKLHEQI